MDAYDLIVAGGGIHGAGVAQAAAAEGRRVLLLEKEAVAAGTSSRSSKLIHGGLRYLESGRLSLVRECLREREILLRVAPGLVRLVPFHIPVYADTTRRPWQLRAGLSLYALLGGLGPHTRFGTVPRRDWGRLDGLRTEGLQAVFRYWDAQTDDAALTRAVLASAASLGAETACPARLLSARRAGEGWEVCWQEAGRARAARASALVNATGPWVNVVQAMLEPRPPALEVDLVQGAHLLLEGRLGEGITYAEAPRDRRAVFVMPWQGKTLVGTTETPFTGDLDDVRPLPQEEAYLLEVLDHYFPGRRGGRAGAFAGLRVLPRGKGTPFFRSREMVLLTDGGRPPRLVAVYGGKLTGYRAAAARVMTLLAPALPPRRTVADTAALALPPG